MADDDQKTATPPATDPAPAGEETGSRATSTGRERTSPEPEPAYSEATLDILTEDEKRALGILPDEPEDEADDADDADADDPDDTAAAPAPAEDDPQEPAKPSADHIPAVDDTEVQRLDKEMRGAMEDLREGEITEDEYEERVADLQKQRDQALMEVASQRERLTSWMSRWMDTVKDYRAAVPELFDDTHAPRYNEYVMAVNADPRPEVQALPMRARLERAHRLYMSDADLYNVDVPPLQGAGARTPKPAAQEPKPAPQKAAKAEPPPTLARMPAAAANPAAEGEFAHLAALEDDPDPTKLENALMKLRRNDPEAHQRYMAS